MQVNVCGHAKSQSPLMRQINEPYQHPSQPLYLSVRHNMEPSGPEILAAIDERVARDTASNFVGTARIWIKHLKFPNPSRQIDRKIITQLKRDFDGEGCNPEKLSNRIPAIIPAPVFQTVLSILHTNAETFKIISKDRPLHLSLGHDVILECLHGQHRVLAAREHLAPSRRWWIVDLYNTGW